MATVGLKGLWGFEQLDRSGMTTWKLCVMIMCGFGLLGALLFQVGPRVNPNSFLAPVYPREVLVFASALFGLAIMSTVALGRSTEADLQRLLLLDGDISEAIKRLRPSTNMLIFCITISILWFTLFLPVTTSIDFELSILESFAALYDADMGYYAFAVLPFMGGVFGVLTAVIFSQILSIRHAALKLDIDLLELNHYSAIANPAVRMILISILGLCLIPALIISTDNAVFQFGMTRIGLLGLLAVTPYVLAYLYPVLILRNRIGVRKQQEMDLVLRALRGDDEANKAICIQGRGAPVSTADLLTHQMFIESRWEWPIAGHVQKLILFGLLPPLTWVLAAVIENTLY